MSRATTVDSATRERDGYRSIRLASTPLDGLAISSRSSITPETTNPMMPCSVPFFKPDIGIGPTLVEQIANVA